MNVIKTESSIIALRDDLTECVQDLIKHDIESEDFGHAHRLLDVLSLIKMYKEDVLLEMNHNLCVRVIEEDI